MHLAWLPEWSKALVRAGSGCLLLTASTLLGCAEPEPNLLLISVDTLRRDHLGTYGYTRDTTPFLDRLAREGVVFEDALSTSNWTLPAHMSLMTGLPPSRHRVRDDEDRLPSAIDTLPAVLLAHGFSTAAFTSHIYLKADFGFGRGFQTYQYEVDQPARKVTDQALAWLSQHPDERFFLFLHYFDPHWSFHPPPEFAGKFGDARPAHGLLESLFPYFSPENTMPPKVREDAITLYDGEIAYTDAMIGKLISGLEQQGRLDDTLVIVVSDHGEAFGEHGVFGHGTNLHAEVTRIPFLARYPRKLTPTRRQDGMVSLMDVPGFALDVLGIPAPASMREFGAPIFGSAPTVRTLILETTRWGPMRLGVHQDGHVLYTSGSYRPLAFHMENGKLEAELLDPVPIAPAWYDRRADPAEQHPAPLAGATRAWTAAREYLDALSPGPTLVCERDPTEPTTVTITADHPLSDEPYLRGAIATTVLKTDLNATKLLVPAGTGVVAATLQLGAGNRVRELRVDSARQAFTATIAEGGHVGPCRLEAGRETPDGEAKMKLSPEERETLEALGYVQ